MRPEFYTLEKAKEDAQVAKERFGNVWCVVAVTGGYDVVKASNLTRQNINAVVFTV